VTEPLSPGEREIVLAAADEEAAIPRPANLSVPGCALFLVSLGLFIAIPRFAAHWPGDVPGVLRFLVFAAIVLGILAGLALFFFFGSGRGQVRARERADEAMERLEAVYPGGARAEQLRAAVRLIANGVYAGGPWRMPAVDVESARDRLGDAIVLVESVERILVDERGVSPVFTAAGAQGGTAQGSIP
jgi:hypothetical protein